MKGNLPAAVTSKKLPKGQDVVLIPEVSDVRIMGAATSLGGGNS